MGDVFVGPDRDRLMTERTYMGNVSGNLEAWLLLRSLRTLELRVRHQCATAARLATWLSEADAARPYVARVWHLSLPSHPDHALARRQMQLFGAVLSIEVRTWTNTHARQTWRGRSTHARAVRGEAHDMLVYTNATRTWHTHQREHSQETGTQHPHTDMKTHMSACVYVCTRVCMYAYKVQAPNAQLLRRPLLMACVGLWLAVVDGEGGACAATSRFGAPVCECDEPRRRRVADGLAVPLGHSGAADPASPVDWVGGVGGLGGRPRAGVSPPRSAPRHAVNH
jgi:hypothetical protein